MHVRGFLLTTIVVRRTVAPETRAVSQDFTRLTRVNPLSDAGGTGLRPRVQGASPSLGRRGARAQQAGPGAQRCPFSESLFPAGNPRAPRKGDTGDRRGAARAPPEHRWAAGPSGEAASARGSGPTGAAGRAGGRARPGPPRPGHPRGSGRRTPRAAAPLAPRLARTSPRLGTPQLGGCAGRAREFPGRAGAGRGGGLSPRSVSPALPRGPPPASTALHGPRTQAVPGRRGVRSASSARSPGRDRHSPRPPRLRAADPRRSLLPR